MTRNNNKFLVNLLSGLTSKQIFFTVWIVITGAFVLMMLAYYRKVTRSNFRAPGDPGPRIDVNLRKLGTGGEGKQVVVAKDNTPRRQ